MPEDQLTVEAVRELADRTEIEVQVRVPNKEFVVQSLY
jgi:hypothetical protein